MHSGNRIDVKHREKGQQPPWASLSASYAFFLALPLHLPDPVEFPPKLRSSESPVSEKSIVIIVAEALEIARGVASLTRLIKQLSRI